MNSIKIKDYLHINNEYPAASAITPGMLIELNGSTKVRAHASAGQNILPMIAFENELEGEGINDAYAADDQVQCWIPTRGDEAYMILADGENVSEGDFLESAGNGYLQKHTPDTEAIGGDSSAAVASFYSNQIVAQALEDLNLSASSGAESSGLQGAQRIKVRIV